MTKKYDQEALHNNANMKQKNARLELKKLFKERPFDDELLLTNFGLFARSSALAKIFFLHEIYSYIVDIPGDIFVFGVWLGQDIVVLESVRAMLEPYNASRSIVGFDTFEGYKSIAGQDNRSDVIAAAGYGVPDGYEKYLSNLMDYHKAENVMGHALSHRLIKGDVTETAQKYIDDHQESIIALAYFDMALYKPTSIALKAISPRLIKGSLIVFDELNDIRYPGETQAFREWIKGTDYKIIKSKILPDRTMVQVR